MMCNLACIVLSCVVKQLYLNALGFTILRAHRVPGARKSQLMKWTRVFFEEDLGWQHAREFVFIFNMNTMEA